MIYYETYGGMTREDFLLCWPNATRIVWESNATPPTVISLPMFLASSSAKTPVPSLLATLIAMGVGMCAGWWRRQYKQSLRRWLLENILLPFHHTIKLRRELPPTPLDSSDNRSTHPFFDSRQPDQHCAL